MARHQRAMLQSVLLVGPAPAGLDRQSLLQYVPKVLTAKDIRSLAGRGDCSTVDLIILSELLGEDEILNFLKQAPPSVGETPIVVASEQSNVDLAVRFVRAGAMDYLAGPISDHKIDKLITGVGAERSRKAARQDKFFCDECPPGVEIVGRSEGMSKALQMIRMIAESRCNPVLILGSTGTGKELAALAVHAWRCGNDGPFVAVNCAALTANLLESELFGHVKGAFTGADREKAGLFAHAGAGTIFLDEISEMPVELQAKLLRVLQERTFRKVGGTQDICCEATIIASSNRNLLEDVEKGKFRRDLYYRLAVFPVTLPALASDKRRSDIPLLAEYFLANSQIVSAGRVKGFTKAALDRLAGYNWPGNVRELRNVIDRALILCNSDRVAPEELILDTPVELARPAASATETKRRDADFSLETAEREFILRALQETGWQRTQAAALLGITRATLHAKLKRYDIQPPAPARSAELPQESARA